MKIYIQDLGVYGCIVVIAETPDEARTFMVSEYNYDPDKPIEEKEITPGFVFSNLGDS